MIWLRMVIGGRIHVKIDFSLLFNAHHVFHLDFVFFFLVYTIFRAFTRTTTNVPELPVQNYFHTFSLRFERHHRLVYMRE